MKKIKLLTPILAIATSCSLLPLTSCNKPAATPTKIEITTSASKLKFRSGDTFSSSGLVLTVTYSDASTKMVTSGFTTDFDGKQFTNDDEGTGKTVTVTYKENEVKQTATYKIDVVATFKVTFTCSQGITLTGETSVVVDRDTTWKDVKKPEASSSIEGYQMLGWYNGMTEITEDTKITSDFAAKYVGYDPKSTLVDVTVVTAKQTYPNNTYLQGYTWKGFKDYYEITTDPQKEGCSFDGWFVGTTKLTDDYIFPTGQTTTTVEAKFTETAHKITLTHTTPGVEFDPEPTGPVEVPAGSTWGEVELPQVKVGESYYGIGWYIEGEYTKLEPTTKITKDITAKYYAWDYSGSIINVDLIIDGEKTPYQFIQGMKWSDFKTYWEINDPTKTGYTFDGWYAGSTKLTDDWEFPTQQQISIEAKFNINQYTVTFAVDEGAEFEGSYNPVIVNYKTKWGDIVGIPSVKVKQGYLADGWYNSLGKINEDTEITENTTATFRTIDISQTKIKVSVKIDDETYGPVEYDRTSTWGKFKEDFKIEAPQKEGYYFDGWTYNGGKIDDDWHFPLDQVAITIEAKLDAGFKVDTWENVCKYANEGIAKLHDVYKHDLVDGKLIGLERTVKINDVDHIVRVIDESHDKLADGSGNKAALTFELVSLLSDKDGNGLASAWGVKTKETSTKNYEYQNSILRKNINGEGAASGAGVWDKNALQMLQEGEPILCNNIKPVLKQIVVDSSYTVKDYSEKLFPLTYTEMNQTGTYAKTEGKAYTYWRKHGKAAEHMKSDVKGEKHFAYWLASEYNLSEDWVAHVNANGQVLGRSLTSGIIYVSFAFCI